MINLLSIAFAPLASHPLYLDPGSGSFLLQLLIAGVAGIGIFLGASWSRIKRLLKGKRQLVDDDPNEEAHDEDYDD